MRTITIDLPDSMPIMALTQFAADHNCSLTLVKHNHFRFAGELRTGRNHNVVAMPSRRQRSANNPTTTPPGAA